MTATAPRPPAAPRPAPPPAAPPVLPAGQDALGRLAMYAAVVGSAVSLHGVIAGWQWWGELAALLALVTLLGFVLGRVLPEPVTLALEVAALLAGLNAFYAGTHSLLGVLPTPDSLTHLVDLVRHDAMESIAAAAPAPATPGMRMVVVGVVLAVWCFVRIAGLALRLPALAGTGLLMLYVLPSTLAPDGVPWWSFVPGALGFVALLAADQQERLAAWGPRAGLTGRRAGMVLRPAGAVLVAVLAVACAVVVPTFVGGMERQRTPTFDELTRSGDQTITVVNPIQSLREDLTAPTDARVLTYRTAAERPDPLRLGTVDVFDGQSWSPTYGRISRRNDVTRGLPDPPGLGRDVVTGEVTTEITVDSLRQNWLSVPYPAQRVEIDGEWLYDEATFNITGPGTSGGQHYTVTSLAVSATPEQLRAAPRAGQEFNRWRQLPVLPPSVLETADEVAGSGTDFDKALAMQSWLRSDGGFEYTLQAPPDHGSDAIEDFLRVRRGYCVHFASTMAVMARAEGIPARVAVGFLPGEQVSPGTWQVTRRDAHAWPELYFEGVGWVAFEPTPPQRADITPEFAQPTPTPQPTPSPTQQQARPTPEATPAPGAPGGPASGRLPVALGVVLGLLALGLALGATMVLVRRRRRAAGVTPELAWQELTSRLAALGVGTRPADTLRQTRDRWVHELGGDEQVPEVAGRLDRLVAEVEDARYAPAGGTATMTRPDVRADVEAVAAAFEPGRPRWRRLWSRLR